MSRATVWVLGAGFSRSLGGPLLPDLLSPTAIATSAVLYPTLFSNLGSKIPMGELQRIVEQHGRRDGQPLWADAEALLDQLDAAARNTDGPAAKRFKSSAETLLVAALQSPLPDLHACARRLVAAATSGFLKDADATEERWQPYKSWAQALGINDTIVTFNYDWVLEHLRRFHVLDTTKVVPDRPEHALALKLHGSVDWIRKQGTVGGNPTVLYESTGRADFALSCEPEHIGIATPGPSKRLAAGELKPLWDLALNRIKTAEVVIFVGYRFPPSDAEAREKLLGALRENTNQKHLRLHLVLGPTGGSNQGDIARLQQLLKHTMKRARRDERNANDGPPFGDGTYTLTRHDLFAEDFLSVWDRGLLWPQDT